MTDQKQDQASRDEISEGSSESPSFFQRFGLERLGLSQVAVYVRNVDLFGVHGVARRYHEGLKRLWLYGFFMSSAGAFYGSYLSLYLLALGASRTQVGWLSSAASFFGMLSPIPGAILSRRSGKPRLMVAIFTAMRRLMLLLAAAAPLFLTGQSLVYAVIGILALRFAFIGLYNPAFISLMAAVIPGTIRGRYLGIRKMAMAMASVVLVPFAGWLISRIGEPVGYQVTLGIAFTLGLVSAFQIAGIPDSQVSDSIEAEREGGSLWEALRTNKIFRRYVLIRLFFNFSRQIGGPYFRVYQKEVLLSPTQTIGLLVTVSAVTRLIGQRVWGGLVDRKGARWVLSVSALMVPFLPLVWIFATKPWHIVFTAAPGGFLWAGFHMGALNLLLNLPEAKYRTPSAAAHTTALRFANMIGPLVGDLVIRQLGYHWDFALSGAGRLVSALLFIWLLKPFGAKRPAPRSVEVEQA